MSKESLVLIPHEVAKRTLQLLTGRGELETVVYWFGAISSTTKLVGTVVRPKQCRRPRAFSVDATANADVAVLACDLGLNLIAQVHTHPGSWVGHSAGDDDGAPFPTAGFYSLVVPNYGREGILPLTRCGVFQYGATGFTEVQPNEVQNRFRIIPHEFDLLG